jgi:peptidoglycan hydrolase-like protein with peptidoglycan-binding domain
VQRALVAANLYDGRIDARPGPQTRAALASLERLTGQQYDLTTPEGREDARRAANRVVPREKDYRRLTADLQRALELAGYPVGQTGPDGLFGVNTRQAYNQARADVGLPPVDRLPSRNYGAIDRLYSDILDITD